MKKLKGKIAFITGASSGIGKACAFALASEGANLILSARRAKVVEKIAEEIRKTYKVDVFAFKLDVKNRKEVEWTD